MQVDVAHTPIEEIEADLACIPLFEGEELDAALRDAPGAGDADGGFRKLTMVRPEGGSRVLVVGLGKRTDVTAERLRVGAALAVRQARRFAASRVAWHLPDAPEADLAGPALVEGTVLADYSFDQLKTSRDEDDPGTEGHLEKITVTGPGADSLGDSLAAAAVVAGAQNRARDLQNLPANTATPSYLAARAEEIAAGYPEVEVEVFGPAELAELGMGGLLAVAAGSNEEPRLIVLRYAGGGSGGTTALVGKGVTFDSGGISIKPSARMHEMKMDMSGGAAVIEAVCAIAELGLEVDVLAVVPATENMPSGTALKPGDVITQYNGKTVEVINTDAEGRLILADALAWSVDQGVSRIVDLATLTGAVLVALGSTYAALLSNDDEWAAEVFAAAERTGELAWRLPLHPEYRQLTRSKVADLTNASEKRKAGTIYAASFLEEFVGEVPWAHLDIAGTAWGLDREYVGGGASGFGVRLLVDLLSPRAEP